MSAKINKNGKGYPLGVLPQNIISKVLNMYKWTKVAQSTPLSLTQGQLTQVTLSATPNLSSYTEVMLVLKDIYTPGGNDTVESASIIPVGTSRAMIASYAYPTGEGYYTRALLNFKSDKTSIDKAYIQDGGNHTNNTFYIEIYAR